METSVEFEEEISNKKLNLAKKLGNRFNVLRNQDTITYHLTFNKETKNNLITREGIDTVFLGSVNKRKDLYLLNEKKRNGNYSIHAIKVTDSTITGLETQWAQSHIINQLLKNEKYNSLITDTSGTTTLKANKRDAKNLFRQVIDSLASEPILFLYEEKDSSTKIELTNQVTDTFNKKIEIYPNPVSTSFTITVPRDSMNYLLYNSQGELTKSMFLNNRTTLINCNELKSGEYYLTIYDAKETLKTRLTKQ